ncbi:MAG TPA: GNAT family N-acetyltransferase [Azospirillaceae bacterium]|nr:GNAT family N-acetyltransferase [Azospirillaceae bacterium]
MPQTNVPALRIRAATFADVPEIHTIYGHHVLTTLSTFEETPPDLAEMTTRFRARIDQGMPWLVAERDGRVAGYAYASYYHARSAYRFTVENSIYIRQGCHRQGIGRRLLTDLIAACTALGFRQMVAVIGDSANHPSIGLHSDLGFRSAGLMESVGFKFGRWVDVVILQRSLGEGASTLPEDKPG